MPKYSTGDRSDDPESCELCGSRSAELTTATVAGARLAVCPSCANHGDAPERDDRSTAGGDDRNRGRQAARNTARLADAGGGDSARWEAEGTNYDADQLPYLRSGYGDRVRTAREEAGLSTAELAEAVDAAAGDVRAVEEGRAARADIGGSLVERLEAHLDVELAED
jgi:ribosome-binding protein aMBF1 (putative translation factor)